MPRYAEKMCVRRGVCLHTSTLTRESLLPVSETYAKKSKTCQLGSFLTVDVIAEFYSVATVSSCCSSALPSLVFLQATSCHSSQLHQLCVAMSAWKLMILKSKLLSKFDLATPVFLGSLDLIIPFAFFFDLLG